jgi:nitrate reductase (NAD(P)H)
LCIGCGTIDKAEFKKQKQVRREKSGPTGLGPDDRRQLRGAGLSRTRSDTTKHGDEKSDKSVKPQQKLDAKKDQKHDEKHEHKSANEAIEHRLEGEDLNLDGDDKIVSPKKEITSPDHVLEIDQNTPDNWIPRSEEQVRLTGAHPLNSEQSLKVLEREGLITSNAVHYVRNHGAVPKLDWKTHKVAVSGLVEKPKEFSMDELSKMPAINIPVTISCDGNRRKEVNAIRHSKGFDWGSGGIGTAFWCGVRLCDILKQVGVKSFADGAKYVCFDGADEPKNGTYGTR